VFVRDSSWCTRRRKVSGTTSRLRAPTKRPRLYPNLRKVSRRIETCLGSGPSDSDGYPRGQSVVPSFTEGLGRRRPSHTGSAPCIRPIMLQFHHPHLDMDTELMRASGRGPGWSWHKGAQSYTVVRFGPGICPSLAVLSRERNPACQSWEDPIVRRRDDVACRPRLQ
jgi:hypothetical protein